jgi:pimeloyl-ACP methyl ester carboxylesterase
MSKLLLPSYELMARRFGGEIRQMISEGFIDFQGYKIWHRIAKPATAGSATPLLPLHGGPGLGSDYLEPLEALTDRGRTVIRFDQLGCGKSDRPRDLKIWELSGCVEQTESIRKALRLDSIHLLGHSWGGMVALEYLLTYPSRVRSLCLCSSVVSVQLWVKEARRLLSLMPSHISKALDRCEKSLRPRKPPEPGAKPAPSLTQKKINCRARILRVVFPFLSNPLAAGLASLTSYWPMLRSCSHEILSIQFNLRHACRLRPMPFGIFRMLAGVNQELYETLWGPSDFSATGLLENWDIRPRLPQIHCPTLILSGLYDVATPTQMAFLKQGIAGSKQIILQQSSHCGMWEEPYKYRAAILGFINRVECANA